MRGLQSVEGRRLKRDVDHIRESSGRTTRKDARTMRTLKRLIHRAERLQGKIACLIGE